MLLRIRLTHGGVIWHDIAQVNGERSVLLAQKAGIESERRVLAEQLNKVGRGTYSGNTNSLITALLANVGMDTTSEQQHSSSSQRPPVPHQGGRGHNTARRRSIVMHEDGRTELVWDGESSVDTLADDLAALRAVRDAQSGGGRQQSVSTAAAGAGSRSPARGQAAASDNMAVDEVSFVGAGGQGNGHSPTGSAIVSTLHNQLATARREIQQLQKRARDAEAAKLEAESARDKAHDELSAARRDGKLDKASWQDEQRLMERQIQQLEHSLQQISQAADQASARARDAEERLALQQRVHRASLAVSGSSGPLDAVYDTSPSRLRTSGVKPKGGALFDVEADDRLHRAQRGVGADGQLNVEEMSFAEVSRTVQSLAKRLSQAKAEIRRLQQLVVDTDKSHHESATQAGARRGLDETARSIAMSTSELEGTRLAGSRQLTTSQTGRRAQTAVEKAQREQIEALSAQVRSLRAAIKQKAQSRDETVTTLRSRVQELEIQLANLRISLEDAEQSLNQEREDWASRETAMLQTVEEANSEVEQLRSQLDSAERRLSQLQQENRRYTEDLAEAETRNNELDGQLQQSFEKVGYLESEVQTLRDASRRRELEVRQEVASYTAQIAMLQAHRGGYAAAATESTVSASTRAHRQQQHEHQSAGEAGGSNLLERSNANISSHADSAQVSGRQSRTSSVDHHYDQHQNQQRFESHKSIADEFRRETEQALNYGSARHSQYSIPSDSAPAVEQRPSNPSQDLAQLQRWRQDAMTEVRNLKSQGSVPEPELLEYIDGLNQAIRQAGGSHAASVGGDRSARDSQRSSVDEQRPSSRQSSGAGSGVEAPTIPTRHHVVSPSRNAVQHHQHTARRRRDRVDMSHTGYEAHEPDFAGPRALSATRRPLFQSSADTAVAAGAQPPTRPSTQPLSRTVQPSRRVQKSPSRRRDSPNSRAKQPDRRSHRQSEGETVQSSLAAEAAVGESTRRGKRIAHRTPHKAEAPAARSATAKPRDNDPAPRWLPAGTSSAYRPLDHSLTGSIGSDSMRGRDLPVVSPPRAPSRSHRGIGAAPSLSTGRGPAGYSSRPESPVSSSGIRGHLARRDFEETAVRTPEGWTRLRSPGHHR